MTSLSECNRLADNEADEIVEEFKSFRSHIIADGDSFIFANFDCSKERLDIFLNVHLGLSSLSYQKL